MSSGPSVRVERSQGRVSRPFIVFSLGDRSNESVVELVERELKKVGWIRWDDEVQGDMFAPDIPELRFVHHPEHPTVAEVRAGVHAARTAMTVWCLMRNQPAPTFKDEEPLPRAPRPPPPPKGACNGELFPVI